MPLDSIMIEKLAFELNNSLQNANIKRIYNISKNEFLVKFQNKQNLYISVNNECRVNITTREFIFPKIPLNFTMILRKYLKTYKLINLTNYQNDRILKLTFAGLNELKDYTTLHLYIELFNRYSNLILTKEDNTIINALKLINNENRSILPNYKYQVEYKENLETTTKIKEIQKNNPELFTKTEPCYTTTDFYFTNIFDDSVVYTDSISQLLDTFYVELDKKRRIDFLAKKSIKKISSEKKKLEKKLKKLDQDLEKSESLDKYKLYGDLILTYGYQNSNKELLQCKDYEGNNLQIKLNENLNVSDNANVYYNKYTKLKRSISHINEQIAITKNRINYLDNLLFQVSISNEVEILEITKEFEQIKNKSKTKTSTILTYNFDNYQILVGKNNLQNEEITFKLSNKNDIWFHVKDLPGSHVLLKTNEVNDEMIAKAASIAAYYSKAKTSPKVEVMYTNIKNVKKISNSYPGHVSIINDFKTIYIEPKEILP